jgi:hypothetical protein
MLREKENVRRQRKYPDPSCRQQQNLLGSLIVSLKYVA